MAGAIAQLGERLVCNQKVAGSIPAGSTTLPAPCRQALSGAMMRVRPHGRPRLIARSRTAGRRVLFNNAVSFVLTLSFQAKICLPSDWQILKLENVAFAM